MAGAFQTSREIFENPIWQNVVEFRLFFLIYGKATFAEGVKVGNTILKRGQWIRSYRNLQSDLEYIENRSIKKYSLSTIHRAVESLIKAERIKVLECELGTLFEVVNYSKYQCFDSYKNNNENAERTESEQQRNNNKKEKKEKNKDIGKKYGLYENVMFTDIEYQKLITEFPNDYQERIERLSGYIASKGVKYKDYLATIRNWAKKDIIDISKPIIKSRYKDAE